MAEWRSWDWWFIGMVSVALLYFAVLGWLWLSGGPK